MKNNRKRNRLCLEHLEWAHAIARHLAGILPNGFTADDLTGPVEIALVKLADQYRKYQRPGFATPVPFRAFAQRRIYGACIDSIRRREYREKQHQSLESGKSLPQASGASPEAQAQASERRQVWGIVQSLPPRHALVILSVYAGDMTLLDLSQLVDVSPSRLSQIHREALGMLRESCARIAA